MNIWSMLDGQRPLPHTVSQVPCLNQRVPLMLQPGEMRRIEVASRMFWGLIVQVTTGALDVCLADSPDSGFAPDFRFVSALGPQQVWIPSHDYTLSVSNPSPSQIVKAVMRILG